MSNDKPDTSTRRFTIQYVQPNGMMRETSTYATSLKEARQHARHQAGVVAVFEG